ncbi:FAD-dependent oxidoreductase [Subtercola frigoramans]|uniref:Assimilatory nitrate reductase electron transfer subunit n=1 Tax=Subtercola frigoramans TaxID=120298 RepID=A0ABS2L437_9MICO|nr:FAD-dependent oxidoreductase [Subtercola frigoramans]MBM7471789.1 assimilatory nitrate reductase electron transfer subunit [Subtercola frigoramans]
MSDRERPAGERAIGERAIGEQAIGERALGERALGERALGERAMRILLIGYGPVGARFVEGMVASVESGITDVTVVGAETHEAYNRVLLADYAIGRASRERLDITDTAAARVAGVHFLLGQAVVGIDRIRQVVRLDSGVFVPYDRLVFATGARANVPTLDGLERSKRSRLARAAVAANLDEGAAPLPAGVVVLRDLADAAVVRGAVVRAAVVREAVVREAVVREAVDSRARVVVLGAGVLGMELALGLAEQGADVVVVYHSDGPMARNLDATGGRMLAKAARAAGVTMASHARAEGLVFHTDDRGRQHFDALVCADGRQIDGDLLVLSCGVTARTELATAADLAVSAGIVVDEELRSWSDPDIYAIGDCAQVAARGSERADGRVDGAPSGLIGPGWRQADWLAGQLAAEAAVPEMRISDVSDVSSGTASGSGLSRTAHLEPSAFERAPFERAPTERASVVMLKAEGVDVVSGGDVTTELWAEQSAQSVAAGESPLEVTQWADPGRGSYLKLVTRDDVLTGFVAVGSARAGAELTFLFERGGELPTDRSALLRLDASDAGAPETSDAFAPDATVCWCNGVTTLHITDAIAAGHSTTECIGKATRAGTGCGGCRGKIVEILARAAPVAQQARAVVSG